MYEFTSVNLPNANIQFPEDKVDVCNAEDNSKTLFLPREHLETLRQRLRTSIQSQSGQPWGRGESKSWNTWGHGTSFRSGGLGYVLRFPSEQGPIECPQI